MNEIEVKILDIDRDKIRRILTVHGATKAFDGTIVSHFFRDTKGQKIRLRRMGKKCFLTAKVKLDHEEVSGNEEFEVEVSDFFTMSQILLLAGLEKYGESIKSRESYHLGDIHYDMDEYPGIPTYIEVESDTAEKVKSGVKLLGYKMRNTVIMTESDLREKWGV